MLCLCARLINRSETFSPHRRIGRNDISDNFNFRERTTRPSRIVVDCRRENVLATDCPLLCHSVSAARVPGAIDATLSPGRVKIDKTISYGRCIRSFFTPRLRHRKPPLTKKLRAQRGRERERERDTVSIDDTRVVHHENRQPLPARLPVPRLDIPFIVSPSFV